MDDPLTYGAWVRRRRRQLDLTQAELAERVGCALTTIEKLEADARRPSKSMAERLADVLLLAPGTRPGFLSGARSGWMSEEPGSLTSPATVERAEPGNALPVPLTPLIGRTREVAAVCSALEQANVRVLTLTGPGGVGKTRLALQVATKLQAAFADGVIFVDLAPIRDPAQVATTIADRLGIPDVAGHTRLARLQAALRQREMLLVLDNFEQVVAAVPVVGTLLTSAPQVKVLLTSRAVAGVYGEHEFPVPPLPLPDPSDLPHLDRLLQVETVRLFVERARAAQPDFCLTGDNVAAVSAICHQLDGLPLAIELAAARVRRFSPQTLLQRFGSGLPGRLEVLAGGPRTAPARQQTVRATIAWSYDLLPVPDQAVFRQLGVFVGGCTPDAAETVCGWDDATHVGASLEALLDNSLLQQREGVDGEVRLTMLETIREYALEQLAASGELELVQRCHAAYCVTLAEGAQKLLSGVAAPVLSGLRRRWWDRLEAEHDNLLAALRWSRTEASSETGLRLVVALADFWLPRGHLNEGYDWLVATVTPRARDVSSGLATRTQQRLRAHALDWLGIFALFLGMPDGVQAWYEESLALFQTLDDRAGRLEVLGDLGMLFVMRGDFDQGQARLDEALALARDLGGASMIAQSLFYLGLLAYAQGQSERAGEIWEEGLRLLSPTEDPMQYASHLAYLSSVALEQGDDGRAGVQVMESLRIFRDLGERRIGILALEVSARLAVAQGQRTEQRQRALLRAARLFGAAEAIREQLASPIMSLDRGPYERGLATLRAHLDDAALRVAWAEGRALTLEQAVAYALEETPDA